jgi:acyl-CoA dehydrogenase
MEFMWMFAFLVLMSVLFVMRASLAVFTLSGILLLLPFSFFSSAPHGDKIFFWILWVVLILPLNFKLFRRQFISRHLLKFYRKIMPKVSQTEIDALEAGDVWWEAEMFQGKPRWKKLLNYSRPRLTPEEQAFLDGPVEEVCSKVNDWKMTHEDADMPEEMWQFFKDNGFFALEMPKKYGGHGFSAYAHAAVVTKLYSVSVTVGVNVSVPNSLGPAELLLHYGTEKQKNYYLPRLAKGIEMPCFALTSSSAGSDASSMQDYGIVCRGEFEGKEVLGMRLTWDKRYITMCPVATILGLAFKLFDPDHLLGEKEEIGITCALIPTNLEGVTHGRRHYPSCSTFQNGPTEGKDVFVPLDFIIGGKEQAGKGWRMLMNCLSVGRAISLPASGVAGVKVMALTTGAYARIRQQFGISVGKFEGVGAELANIASLAYESGALHDLTMTAVSLGERPSVCSAISKYHCTENARKSMISAMDVHSGKAVMLGPKNYVARAYQEVPIGITVEGANILTRNMIIFGQGAFRCHPYAYAEWSSAQMQNKKAALKAFDKALFGHLGYTFSNFFRSFFIGLSGGRFTVAPKGPMKRYFQHLTRFSAAYALVSDLSMLLLGGSLKRKERISARLADVLSDLFIGSAVLKRYQDDGCPKLDRPFVDLSMKNVLHRIEKSFDELLRNFPLRWAAWMMRVLVFPLGRYSHRPADKLEQRAAGLLMHPNAARDRLTEHMYIGKVSNENNNYAINEAALRKAIDTEALFKKVRQAYKKGELKTLTLMARLEEALKKQIISEQEHKQMLEAEQLRQQVIAVDDFATEDLQK